MRYLALIFIAAVGLTGCAETRLASHVVKQSTRTAPAPIDPDRNYYKVGSPYVIQGIRYEPEEDESYAETGIASWYGPGFHGKLTANGEIFDENALTAAHKTLPMPSLVRVTNLENGRALVVRINDRGPFAPGRIIDMSRHGARLLGFEKQGLARVKVEILAAESRALADAARNGNPEGRGLLERTGSGYRLASTQQTVGQETYVFTQEGARAEIVGHTDNGRFLPDGPVQPAPIAETRLFVQAASFREPGNAAQLQRQLAAIGPALVQPATVGGIAYYRVRLGPVADVGTADDLLRQVIDAGFGDARIIVD